MKIIEAMKEAKLIEKKIRKNNELITEYSSALDNEKLPFLTEEEQIKEVKKLVQSNIDLEERYISLKVAIDRTNLATKVSIEGAKREYTIFELLVIKRKFGKTMIEKYTSMNGSKAEAKRMSYGRLSSEGKAPSVIKFYDEREKNNNINDIENFLAKIDSRLEVVNAVTDIIE